MKIREYEISKYTAEEFEFRLKEVGEIISLNYKPLDGTEWAEDKKLAYQEAQDEFYSLGKMLEANIALGDKAKW